MHALQGRQSELMQLPTAATANAKAVPSHMEITTRSEEIVHQDAGRNTRALKETPLVRLNTRGSTEHPWFDSIDIYKL